jgi:CheY-like chemotaxis protein
LVSARDEAERANRAKSQFISHMSHELRTPLNAVLGFGQLLATDRLHPLPDHQLRQVQEILRGGKHLLDLISDLLELGCIEAGQLLVELEAVPLADLVSDCMSLVAPLAKSHGVQLLAPGPDDLTFCALADRRRIKQVLLNLLGNAIKYNLPAGRAELECHATQNEVYIGVHDTGPGLSAEEQHRLFRPFERLGAAQSGIEGSGIGLALSWRLIEAMNGTIGVESALGRGSTFWIRLPLATSMSVERAGTASDAASQPRPTTGAPNRIVLCIEDNPVNMLLMEAMLASIPGIRMTGASTPEEGLEIAMRERPALILLDIQLPRLDGFEVLRRLQADEATSTIPVVAVSANAMRVDVEAGLAAGFQDYITKPVELRRLTSVVSRLAV